MINTLTFLLSSCTSPQNGLTFNNCWTRLVQGKISFNSKYVFAQPFIYNVLKIKII